MECQFVPSVCSYCGVGCGVLFQVVDGKLIGTLPLKTHPVNEGRLCVKGWNLHDFSNSYLRLKSPLIRAFGRFIKTSWEEAIKITSDRLTEIVGRHGPDSVGVLVSAKMTNEENYLAQKFARAAVGTNNVDHCARL
jgi:predicted molibdopterin-dependent oxidoreductase YjgC